MFRSDDSGAQERPRNTVRTLIEFMPDGRFKFERINSDEARMVRSKTGTYTLGRDEIMINDDQGNSVSWPCSVADDRMMIVMPELKKKFYWRRIP
ncbi:hypothetical protein ACFL2Q_08215 [Thermodesulfobacteriota bacterium]